MLVVKCQMSKVKCSQGGFTLIELLVVVAVLTVALAISVPNIVSLIKNPKVSNTAEEVVNALKLAQNKSLSSEGNSQYGVYFKTDTAPHQYILFKGANYASRDISFDQAYSIPNATEFYDINLGGGNEIVFNRITGTTQNPGNVSIRLKDDYDQKKTIHTDAFGITSFVAPASPSDAARIKDSRHVGFNYSRVINTASENVILTFNGVTMVTLPMSSYVTNGQFYWQGTTSVAGSDQIITIHTLRLNNPDTRFSVFRDRRFNDKSLTINISGDSSGTLAEYLADGSATDFHSIYVSGFAWQ